MKIKPIIMGFILAMTLVSCGTEFKLANAFMEQSKRTRVAVYFPEAMQVTLIQDKDGDYSRVLDSVNQNMFLDIMYAAYADALEHYGLDVYVPEDQDEIQTDSTNWLVLLSNVEAQGFYSDHVDHLFDIIDEYDYTFSLNTVNVASWFDINDGDWHPTLFDEHNLKDDFSSYVTQSGSNGTQYHYNITSLNADDVYNYAVFLGKRYAGLTYDYMMNRYISSEMAKKGRYARFKLRWEPEEKKYYFQEEEEGFVELEVDS